MCQTDRSNSPFPKFISSLLAPLILGLVLMGCSGSNSSEEGPQSAKAIVADLDSLFLELAALETDGSSISPEAVKLNEQIRRTIENIHASDLLVEIGELHAPKAQGFNYALSPDHGLAIFSWYTKLDASGNKIKNMALFKMGDGLRVSSLLGSPLIYGKVHQVESYKGDVLYILQGRDTSAVANPQRLDAYTLENGQLQQAPAFPNNESSISIAKMEEHTDPLGFKVVMNGSRILFPDIDGKAVRSRTLAFNGTRYVPESEIE